MAGIEWGALGREILQAVGGEGNVRSVNHCATRLRFQLRDSAAADRARIETLPGVISVVEASGQLQVVVGNNVARVYEGLGIAGNGTQEPEPGTKGNIVSRTMELISAIFAPVIWLLASTGLFKALLVVAVQLGWLDPAGQTYTILNAAADAFFYFLPILLAVSVAKRFRANMYVAMTLGGALVYPSIAALASAGEPVSFLGIPVVMMSYASSVIPIIVAVWVQSYLERGLQRILPDAVRNLLMPLLTLAIMVPLVLITIGPASTYLSQGISNGITWLWSLSPLLGGALLGGLVQALVMFGLHWGLLPVMINDLSTQGYSLIFGPLMPAGLAQAAAALAVMFRSRDRELKKVAGSASLSGFVAGVTEPAIYGVNLRLKRPFAFALAGGAVGGAIAAVGGSGSTTFIFPGLLALPALSQVGNFTLQLVGSAVAIVIAFGLTFVLGVKEPKGARVATAPTPAVTSPAALVSEILAPVAGRIVQLTEVGDKVFASGVLGKGVGIVPEDGRILAPVSGTVVTAMKTGHAFGIRAEDGTEVLVHIGIDTVQLEGRHFELSIEAGSQVTAGQPVGTVDLAAVREAGYDTTVIVVITNSGSLGDVLPATAARVDAGQPAIVVER
ncbi:MAG: beta-glucoside-specific PTS transporter subunit IIABC [Propionicimonas sp.]